MPIASLVTAIAKLSEELIALEDNYEAHNYKPLDVVISRASGAWMLQTACYILQLQIQYRFRLTL
jgi:hypothetical protein